MPKDKETKLKELRAKLTRLLPKAVPENLMDSSAIVFAILDYLDKASIKPPMGVDSNDWKEFEASLLREYILLFISRFEVKEPAESQTPGLAETISDDEKIELFREIGKDLDNVLARIIEATLVQEINLAVSSANLAAFTVLGSDDLPNIIATAVRKSFQAYLNNVILPEACLEYLLQSHFYELDSSSPVRREKIDRELRAAINGDESDVINHIMDLSRAFTDEIRDDTDLPSFIADYLDNISAIVQEMNKAPHALIRMGTLGGQDKSFSRILEYRIENATQAYLAESHGQPGKLQQEATRLAEKTLPEKILRDALIKSLTAKGTAKFSEGFAKENITDYLKEVRSALGDKQGLFDKQIILNKVLSSALTRDLVLPKSVTAALPKSVSTPSVDDLKRVFTAAVTEYKKRTRFDQHSTFLSITWWSLHHGEEGQKRVEELSHKITAAATQEEITQLLVTHFLHAGGGTRYKSFKPTLDGLLSSDPATAGFWQAIKKTFIDSKVEPLTSMGDVPPYFSAPSSSDSSRSSSPIDRGRSDSSGSGSANVSSADGEQLKAQYIGAICAHLDRTLAGAETRARPQAT